MTGKPEHNHRRPDVAAMAMALALAILGGVMLWDSSRLADLGGYSGVGPASAPRLIGGALIILAIWTLIAAIKGDFPERPRQEVGPVVWIIAGLAGQLLLLNTAGFSIATAVLFACTAAAFGKRNLPFTFFVGLVFSFAVWFVFTRYLMLHLPAGPLENLILGGA